MKDLLKIDNNLNMEEKLRLNEMIGRKVRHFKNKEYLVIDVAWHTENEESVIIYRALYGDCLLYVRPAKMFLSKVDRDKYPNVEQEYRMELVNEG